jgi:hypothetical protein
MRRELEQDRRRKHEPDRPSGAACPGKEALIGKGQKKKQRTTNIQYTASGDGHVQGVERDVEEARDRGKTSNATIVSHISKKP